MKVKNGFVSNSSSTSFIITNHTDKTKTLVDFVKETPEIIEEYRDEYGTDYDHTVKLAKSVAYVKTLGDDDCDFDNRHNGNTQKNMILCAEKRGTKIPPGDGEYIFGDEDEDIIGRVYDYMLRYGGRSKSFSWKFSAYLR